MTLIAQEPQPARAAFSNHEFPHPTLRNRAHVWRGRGMSNAKREEHSSPGEEKQHAGTIEVARAKELDEGDNPITVRECECTTKTTPIVTGF